MVLLKIIVVFASVNDSIPISLIESRTFVKVELENLPNTFSLFQNYPNPFNPTSNIDFQLPQISVIKLELYFVTGAGVAMLLTGSKNQDIKQVKFAYRHYGCYP